MGWIKYFLHWDRRPRIPHHLVNRFDMTAVNEDELLILMAGKARDREYIERLMKRYQASTALELLQRLPKRKRPSIRDRFHALILRAEGSLPYDPLIREVRAIKAEARTPAGGIRRARLKGRYR